jgi:RecJ-like exonuclease
VIICILFSSNPGVIRGIKCPKNNDKNTMNTNNNMDIVSINNSMSPTKSLNNKKVLENNKNSIYDLDGICFYDNINMDIEKYKTISHSNKHVPRLNLKDILSKEKDNIINERNILKAKAKTKEKAKTKSNLLNLKNFYYSNKEYDIEK